MEKSEIDNAVSNIVSSLFKTPSKSVYSADKVINLINGEVTQRFNSFNPIFDI